MGAIVHRDRMVIISMNNVKKFFSNRLTMFAIISIVLLALSFFYNRTVFPYDSKYYWNIADPVFENQIDILSFPETFRGCLFPILVGIIKRAVYRLGFDSYWGWRILISGMIAAILVYAFPIILKKDTAHIGWTTYLTNAVFILIFSIFWGDFIQYPLSDLPACFFMLMGIAALIWVKDKSKYVHKIVYGIIAGALLYTAYNVRVAFLYGVLIVIIVFCAYILIQKTYKNFLVVISLIIGILLAATPQMMINHQYIGSWSPKVYTEQNTGYQVSAQSFQVFEGLRRLRYETYFGDKTDYPIAPIAFDDPIGQKIIEIEGITLEEFSYGTVFKLFIKYPLDIGGIYIRHLISLMTPIFATAYIKDMYAGKGILISLAIFTWMVAAIDILFHNERKFDSITLWMLIAMVFPSLLQMAGMPEIRFFLMVHLLLYYYISNIIDYKKLYQNIKRRWLPIAIVCTVIYFMWISNVGMILSYNEIKVLIINDKHYECISEMEETNSSPY